MSQIAFGRRVSKDENDKRYAMQRVPRAKAITSRYWWTPDAYDQGSSSMCVAYSGVRYLTTAPINNRPIDFPELYRECLLNDEWPGEDEEGGTSVRGLFKVLKSKGAVSEYRWAFEAEPVIDHLLTRGPVVFGTYWSEEMSHARRDGYLTLGKLENVQDGHAWCAIGANRNRRNPDGTRGAIRAVNSWGTGWGDHGRFWVSFRDVDRLIKLDGEACVAMEVKLAALEAAFGDSTTMMA